MLDGRRASRSRQSGRLLQASSSNPSRAPELSPSDSLHANMTQQASTKQAFIMRRKPESMSFRGQVVRFSAAHLLGNFHRLLDDSATDASGQASMDGNPGVAFVVIRIAPLTAGNAVRNRETLCSSLARLISNGGQRHHHWLVVGDCHGVAGEPGDAESQDQWEAQLGQFLRRTLRLRNRRRSPTLD